MPFIAGYHNSPLLMILFQNMISSLDNNDSRIKVDSYLLMALTRVYAGTRCTVHTSGVCLYVRIRAHVRPRVQTSWTFRAGVDTSSNQMRLQGWRSTNGYRRHGNLHACTLTFILIFHNASARRNIGHWRCPAWRIRALMKSKSMNPALLILGVGVGSDVAVSAGHLRNFLTAIIMEYWQLIRCL